MSTKRRNYDEDDSDIRKKRHTSKSRESSERRDYNDDDRRRSGGYDRRDDDYRRGVIEDGNKHSRKSDSTVEVGEKRKKSSKKEKEKRKESKHSRKDGETLLDKLSYIDLSAYSNADNPFNDTNLGEKFEWTKKKDRERKLGISPEEAIRREKERREETQAWRLIQEIRRSERERERQLREEELARIQREAENASLGDWASKEDSFHLDQSKKRAEIRIKENRAKPIDILAINLRLADENDDVDESLEIDVDEPYTIFEVEELHQDIQKYLSLEKNPNNLDFWRAMIVVCDDKLSELREDEKNLVANVIAPVKDEINNMMAGKTYEQLNKLQAQIQQKLSSKEPVEVEFWEQQLKTLTVWKAKAKLKAMHEIVLHKRLEQLRKKQRQEAIKVQEELEYALASHGIQHVRAEHEGQELPIGEEAEKTPEPMVEEYDRSMSPKPIEKLFREDKQYEIIDPKEDLKKLKERRREVLRNQFIPMKVQPKKQVSEEEEESMVSKVLYEREAAKDLDEDEAIFNIEEELAKT
ncbi:3890_t:CDS:10, partial [Acaulospora colombiana]